MRSRWGCLALLSLAVASAAPTAQAAAAERLLPPLPPRKLMTRVGAPVPPLHHFRSGFQVKPSSGNYEVGVSTFGNSVLLTVFNEARNHFSQTLYVARGVATPNRLQATFGQFGKVLMRFHESSKHTVCHGTARFLRRKGVFAGNLRFRGEKGYVSVRVHRASGGILEPSGRCPRRRHQHDHFDFSIFLETPSAFLAVERQGVNSTGLLALEFGPLSEVFAFREESRGQLAVLRDAFIEPRKAFHVNEAASAASVSLASPFHGHGYYRAAPDGSSTWSGNLSVNFPGAPRFPLTGPDFKTYLEAPF
jgi:hypothetical protein